MMQGKGFEPSDSFETGCLIKLIDRTLHNLNLDLKSCAVGQAWLPLQKQKYADAGNRTRAEGLEGPNHSL